MIKLIRSTFYKEEETKKQLIEFIKDAPILSMKERCKEFEENFAKKQKRKYAVFVSSGSTANLALIQSILNLGLIKKGDRVAFSTLTWATNVMPLIQLGLQPVPVDCSLSNLCITKDILEETYKKQKFEALFLTNVLGFSGDIDKIEQFCNEKNILLLEDNCESLGSALGGRLLGNFSLASTFSTFVGHHLSTVEGGLVCTDDEDLYHMLLTVRAHGWDRNLPERHKNKLRKEHVVDDFNAKYTFYNLAYNIRPTEMQGVLGNIQLKYWDEIVSRREHNFYRFLEATRSNDDIVPLKIGHMSLVSNFTMPVVFRDKRQYTKYKNRFSEKDVEIRPVIAGNIVKQPFLRDHLDYRKMSLPNSDLVHENGFYFANNPELTDDEVDLLCSLLEK